MGAAVRGRTRTDAALLLILTPLAVARQVEREGVWFGKIQ